MCKAEGPYRTLNLGSTQTHTITHVHLPYRTGYDEWVTDPLKLYLSHSLSFLVDRIHTTKVGEGCPCCHPLPPTPTTDRHQLSRKWLLCCSGGGGSGPTNCPVVMVSSVGKRVKSGCLTSASRTTDRPAGRFKWLRHGVLLCGKILIEKNCKKK